MAETRKGRQTPTQSLVLPYTRTDGQEAINLYNSTGNTALEWQELLIADILAKDKENLWVHEKFGYEVPRRNGKNEILIIREMFGLKNGEHILHTAHRTTTTHAAWERLCKALTNAGINIVGSLKAYGRENIEIDGGGKIEFRTRTSKGGLGEGYDILIIDEAQEYQDDQESALKYVVTDAKNPQTIYCGTPPTPTSSGTVFQKYRKAVLSGGLMNSGWAEWSVEEQTNPHDREAWYMTNPSLGTVLTERKILAEIGEDTADFNIQRLGLWIHYNQKSAISSAEWGEMKEKTLPALRGKLYVGIKYSQDGSYVSMSIAVKTAAGKVFIESIDCRSARDGDSWILRFLKSADISKVVVDGASGQNLLASEMKEARIKQPLLPTVKEVITANAMFDQAICAKTICHMGQPSLEQSVCNCEKRQIGSNGGFGYRSIKPGSEISLMDSAILAYWLCYESKDQRRQHIRY